MSKLVTPYLVVVGVTTTFSGIYDGYQTYQKKQHIGNTLLSTIYGSFKGFCVGTMFPITFPMIYKSINDKSKDSK